MTPGPLRRMLGALGLLLLAPVAWRLASGSIAPTDAAIRAVLTLGAVIVVGRVATAWIGGVARSIESDDGVAGGAGGAG